MHPTFHVPTRFHPAHALLGRLLRRRIGDPRRAEALFLVVLSVLLLLLLQVQYVAWAWLKPAITAAPAGPTAVAFWVSQAVALVLFVLTCVVGFAPAVTVTTTRTGLYLQYGERERTLSFTDITTVESVSALVYHRHYARYAATQAYVNRVTPQVLLLHTTEGPVALGLLPEDHVELLHQLQERLAPAFDVPVSL